MVCTGCNQQFAGQSSTWVLQEPNDLKGWRAHLCDACDGMRNQRPVQNRVVLTLRKLVKEATISRSVERV